MTDAVSTAVAPTITPLDTAALLAAALQLPPKERELLADQLWESVDRDADLPMTKDGFVDGYALLGPEWMEEIQRRVEQVRRGEAVLLDGEEVLRELRAKYPE